MKKFIYKAWDDEFNVIKEEIEDNDADEAFRNLKSRGLKVIYVKEKFSLSRFKFLDKKLDNEILANFCGQTAMILNSGISLLNGLEIMEQQIKNKNMKKIILNITDSIKKGNGLDVSMESCGKFPKLLIDMVKTGEISGNLDTVLYNMESFYKKEASIKSKIKSAAVYPMLILIVALGMLVFFNFIVFPEIKGLFEDMKLPAITVIVLGIMNFFDNNYMYIIICTIIAVIFFKYINTISKVAYFVDKFKLKIPILGDVKLDIITARFTRSMGIFLNSGIPIITIMDNVQLVVENVFISKKMDKVKNQLVGGTTFADSIESENIFKPLVTQMMRVGQETGKLDEIMFKLADIYDEKVETGVARIMSLVEPILTLVIGLIVGVVILGVALPIVQMAQGVK
ncbi:type II secretion system F family protein [Clostridium sp. AWRP]|uniref:type II secretion system F family protein n=1 Tax=Clostridium sp. AWRP TaxID=2212991 RepID=UPI000FDACACD|nr:type II secretion system F family protein [Clostridium sp. AWRP]AZV55563.1 type II secretion system F family protein [Clostridium sp. AWRP]